MGDKSSATQVNGVTPSFTDVANTPLRDGRFITEEDVAGRDKVAVVGVSVIDHLLGDKDLSPLGQSILINRIPYRIIGVTKPKGSVFGQDQDDFVLVPITTALHRIFNRTNISYMQVQCASAQSMDLATEQITDLLRRRHNLHPPFPDDDDFQIGNQAQILQAFGAVSGVLDLLLGGVAFISLLVGGIGIMNIMLVSVTERTREIGLRKAVGATQTDILVQFLIEAVLLSVVGGLIGLALGIGVVATAVSIIGWPLIISPGLIALAVVVSATIGILFGSYPAAKAARQNPIDCLRYE
jgi:putative ABC transport system permease protein